MYPLGQWITLLDCYILASSLLTSLKYHFNKLSNWGDLKRETLKLLLDSSVFNLGLTKCYGKLQVTAKLRKHVFLHFQHFTCSKSAWKAFNFCSVIPNSSCSGFTLSRALLASSRILSHALIFLMAV